MPARYREPVPPPSPSSLAPVYVALLLGTMLVGMVGIILTSVLDAGADHTTSYVLIIGFCTSTLASGLAFVKSHESSAISAGNAEEVQKLNTKIATNMDDYIEEVKKSAYEAGRAAAEKALAESNLKTLPPGC